MTLIKVKNLKGTSDNNAPSGSWIKDWERVSGKKATKCSYCGSISNLVGAHIKKVDSIDNDWYIVPFCSSCNQTEKEFLVDSSLLVSVNNIRK
ncbi:MAG: hypothetical protein Ta2D_13980 [Rickettsiales bacterium]|nr:MAG: hypothetical protein Ta2D_13980 [Rickettsiales bacterium]